MTPFKVRQRGYLQSSEKGATADPMCVHLWLRLRLRLRFESLPDLPSLKCSSHWSLGLYPAYVDVCALVHLFIRFLWL
jgi:hypothetical protein